MITKRISQCTNAIRLYENYRCTIMVSCPNNTTKSCNGVSSCEAGSNSTGNFVRCDLKANYC